MNSVTLSGLKLRLGKYTLRVWKNGFEFGNNLGGRAYIFPWAKHQTPGEDETNE